MLLIEQSGRGGIADYTERLAAALADEGEDVALVTATDHRYPVDGRVRVLRHFAYVREGTLLRRVLRPRGVRRVFNGLRFLGGVPRLVRLASRARVVHAQGWEDPGLGAVAVAAMRAAGAPVVLTPHNSFERRGSRPHATRLLHRLAARVIVHAQADLPNLPERDRAVIIPHGEYGSLARTGGGMERAEARAQLGIDPDDPAVLLFGQMRADKGIGDLLEAARHVPRLRVLLAGEEVGGLAAARKPLEAPELAGRVKVREGFLEMDEAARWFAAADAVVFPYSRASQSGVLLLSYGFARPVVAYPVGGLPEAIVDGETGWLCECPEPAALARALADVAEAGWAECRRRGERGREFAARHYAWPAIAERTREVYDAAVAGEPATALEPA